MDKDKMYDNLVLGCRNNEELEELDISHADKISFWSDEIEARFNLNNMVKISPISLIHNDNLGEFFYLPQMTQFLNYIDPILFQLVTDIVVITGDSDIDYLEEEYCKELLDGSLGQHGPKDGVIVVNLRLILARVRSNFYNNFNDCEYDVDCFIEDVMGNFITTLLHELAHSNANDLLTDIIPNCNIIGEDTEENIESYATNLFEDIECSNISWKFLNREVANKYMEKGESFFGDDYSKLLEEEYL